MAGTPMDVALVEQITRRVVDRLRNSTTPVPDKPEVLVNISVRHIHLCREDVDILYGPGFELEVRNKLYQTGQFASKQAVTLVGPRMRCLGEVRVLGPLRKRTQIEVSKTDSIYLGIDPPVRPSGNHEGSIGLIMVGPIGVVHLTQGVILANRHIHLSVESAQKWGFVDNQIVQVRVQTHKKTLFEDVQLRVHETYKDEMHVDTDDGNACGLRGGEFVKIIAG